MAISDQVVTLSDGRRLSCLQVGDPTGVPLISCHGGLSSRLDVLPADVAAESLGVRVISPDRPGIGGSTRQPGRTLLDWPDDVAELADRLGLASFAVLGWSAGGMYAMACAVQLNPRVRALGLVASVIPRNWPGMTHDINRMDRVFMRLSHAGAPVERSVFTVMRAAVSRRPEGMALRSGVPAAVAGDVGAAIAQGLADTRGVVDEYRLLDKPWGFEPESISVPTHIWQGTADDLVPESWGTRLAEAIPGAELTVVEGGSHFLWYDHWTQILSTLSRPD